jgi:uncharacterized protein YhfF
MAGTEPVHFRFGDSRALCDELTALVLAGRKTATCFALRDVESGAETMPVVGRRDVAANWDGTPVALVETTEVAIRRFGEVDEAFALAEGENDSLAGWRAGHRRYFERNGGWSPDLLLVCERFRLVEDLRRDAR